MRPDRRRGGRASARTNVADLYLFPTERPYVVQTPVARALSIRCEPRLDVRRGGHGAPTAASGRDRPVPLSPSQGSSFTGTPQPAPRAPPTVPARVRRVRGCLLRNQRGRLPAPNGLPFGTRADGDFGHRCKAAAFRMMWTARSDTAGAGGHVPFGGLRLGAIAGRSAGNGRSGPPGARAISPSFQAPAVCTWESDGAITSRRSRRPLYCKDFRHARR